jgi:hypothetical protein
MLRAGSSASPGSAGRSASAAGRFPARPNRSSKKDGPNPTVTVSPAGPRSKASPVSTGGACGAVSVGPIASPAVIRDAAAAQEPSTVGTACTSVVVMSNAANASRAWAGVAIPA